MHISLLIYVNNLSYTCFEQINYSLSGCSLLYMQHMVFNTHLRWLAANTFRVSVLAATKLSTNGRHECQFISLYVAIMINNSRCSMSDYPTGICTCKVGSSGK
jgi:hypothetical protein